MVNSIPAMYISDMRAYEPVIWTMYKTYIYVSRAYTECSHTHTNALHDHRRYVVRTLTDIPCSNASY